MTRVNPHPESDADPPSAQSKFLLRRSKILHLSLLCLAAIALIVASDRVRPIALLQPIQGAVFWAEEHYQAWFEANTPSHPIVLLPFAFLGGLISSISPCILSLLPVNLTYIGTREIRSRRDALQKATAFVLGVVTVLSLFGLFSSFASLVIIRFQGYVYVTVGLLILLMGLALLEMVPVSLPQTEVRLPFSGAYGFGLTFALVSSPCTSPFLFAVLGAAAATGSHVQSVLTMVSYALGYTAVIFCASLFAGLAKRARWLLQHSDRLLHFGGAMLCLIGVYYLVTGVRWMAVVWVK